MQTNDFVALATRVSGGAEGIRACLIQSREGLTLGAHPQEAEPRLRQAWRGLQALGDAQRGFVDLGEEIVVVARRGPYLGVALAAPDVRPGLVLDVLDAQLAAAEVGRTEAARAEEPAEAPRAGAPRRRRPGGHAAAARRGQAREIELPAEQLAKALAEPEGREEPSPVSEAAVPAASNAPSVVEVPDPEPARGLAARLRRFAGGGEAVPNAPPAFEQAVAGPAASAPPDEPAVAAPPPEAPRVDRAALAREFGRLFTEPEGGRD